MNCPNPFLNEKELEAIAKFIPAAAIEGAFSHRGKELDMFLHELGHSFEIWTNPKKDNSRLLEPLMGTDSVLTRAYGRVAAENEAKVFAFARAFYDKYKIEECDELMVSQPLKTTHGDYICMCIQYGHRFARTVKDADKEKAAYKELILEYYDEFMTLDMATMWEGICAYVVENMQETDTAKVA